MSFILDTNILIDAKNRYYDFDICPGFWEYLNSPQAESRVYIITEVKDEIASGKDELSLWIRNSRPDFILKPTTELITAMKRVSEWTETADYKDEAKRDFLSKADYFLVAHALAGNHCLVTHEVRSNGRSRIKIPDACANFKIESISPFEMLRRENVTFNLETL